MKASGLILMLLFTAACATTTTSINDSHPDFGGLWVVTEYDEIVRPEEHAEYTEEAIKRSEFFKNNFNTIEESHAVFCGTTGTPWSVLGRARDYPAQIIQTEDTMVFFFEYMDQVRQIHLDQKEFPDFTSQSFQGYSIAHWEGNELIVETEGFTSTSEATIFHRSDEARVVETWRLKDHPEYGEVLEIELYLHDPVFYKVPAYGRTLLMRAPEGSALGTYNCPATLWDNFIEQRIEEKSALKSGSNK